MSKEREIKIPETDFEKVLFLNAYIKYLKIEHGKQIAELHEEIFQLKKHRHEVLTSKKKVRPGHLETIDNLTKKVQSQRATINGLLSQITELKNGK